MPKYTFHQGPESALSLHFTSALDRPSGPWALVEALLVPAGGDAWLGAAGALETAKVTSLSLCECNEA